ncbi:hypothetical protein NIES267_23200 [Calothrix parasitica NIES-267]|uniref:DUF2934 domain-containing protein n=1 Tax=Calothrix parasitica NIES-267 TaxID=1973488 RepID=A0A1Z4LNK1_9CYAN|nr:hypothetical protein NIES267_23200 [Calothrix parasitica NIES-267]
MPYDITLCPGESCLIKQNCYRFTLKVLGRQNFFTQIPCNSTTNSCEHFISNRPPEEKIRIKAYQIWQQMGRPSGQSLECWLKAEKELM